MASSPSSSTTPTTLLLLSTIFTFFLSTTSTALNQSSSSTSPLNTHLSDLKSFCSSTPYPDSCFHSLKLSIDINISPTILTFLLQTLRTAISESTKLTTLLSAAAAGGGHNNIVEKQRGSVQDCRELHQITVNALQRSLSRVNAGGARRLADARAYLSAAVTNKNTCLEGLESASGPMKPAIVSSVVGTYRHVSNSLSILSRPGAGAPAGRNNRRLLGFPAWVPRRARRILQSSDDDYDEYDPSETITVAGDGSGNFTTITEAINFAPNNSYDRVIIFVREGVYEENVEIPSYKTNIVLLGDGSDLTVVTGSRSVAGGWTTFRSATVAVSGEGFLARDMSFENRAGPASHQAVALRINADLAALYRCAVSGYQDTLYAHSFRQFYRECDISGTVDFIFGNAAAVFQASNIVTRLPMKGQFTVVTAQSRETADEDTGFSIQNCSVVAAEDLYSGGGAAVRSYLGRPWRGFSRTVVLESYIDGFVDPAGWREWAGEVGLGTLYYGEYENYGPGSGTGKRVGWAGFHVMDYYDAYNFTVAEFITGDAWLDSTSFPYDDGV